MPSPELDISLIGRRVVVRWRTGGTGPSGGPEMTDVIGHVRAVTADLVTIQRRDDTMIDIRVTDIVTWKVVPPQRTPTAGAVDAAADGATAGPTDGTGAGPQTTSSPGA